jgi:hypothetical protein
MRGDMEGRDIRGVAYEQQIPAHGRQGIGGAKLGLVNEWLKAWLRPPILMAPLNELENPFGPPLNALLNDWLWPGALKALLNALLCPPGPALMALLIALPNP